MASVTLSVRREGATAYVDETSWSRLSVVDHIDRRGDGVDVLLNGDWSNADAVRVRIEDDGSPSRAVVADATVLSSVVTRNASGATTTRLKAGRRQSAAGSYYTDLIRAQITDANLRALSRQHAAWSSRFATGTSFASSLLQLLDEDEATLDEYIQTLADYRIGFRLDPMLPATGETAGSVALYARDVPRGATFDVSLDDSISWSQNYDRYANPLGAWSTSPVSYLVGGASDLTSSGSGDGEPEDLGEFALSALALARVDAYRSERNHASLTGELTLTRFTVDMLPRAGVTILTATPGNLLRWLVDGVSLDFGIDGGLKNTLTVRATQRLATT